jgi:hypothetical protein
MSNRARLRLLLVIGAAASPTAATAGAWTLDAGTAQAIMTATSTTASQAFDGAGNLQSTPRYNKTELQGWFEYGVTNPFTVIVAPQLQHVDIAAPTDAQRTGLGYTEFGGRYRLLQGESWVVSGQATLRVPGTYDNSNPAAIGYTDVEADVRGLVGYSFSIGKMRAFADLEIAQRFSVGPQPSEFRADATLGVWVTPRWLLMAQSFNVVSEGSGNPPFTSYDYCKFQLSAVYAVTPALSLQLGGVTTYAGSNALQENGLVVGAWYRW